MKKLLFLPLTLLFLTPLAHADFPDVPATSEQYEAVSALEGLGVVKGYPDGTFKLDQPVQRDELLKMAYLAEAKHNLDRRSWAVSKLFPFGKESSIKVDPLPFGDVKSTDWAAPYIAWGKQQGLIGGYPDGSFKSTKGVNFAEAAKMLVETSFHPSVRQGEHWAEGYIEILGMGMIPPSIQKADQVLTRGQVADLIYNYTLANDEALSERPSNVLIWENGKYLTFECLGAYDTLHFLRKDAQIYWRNIEGAANLYSKLEGADAATFEVLENGLSKDKNQYYYYTDPLKVALPNVESLEFLTPNLAKEGDKAYYFRGPGDVQVFDYIGNIPVYAYDEYYMTDGEKIYFQSGSLDYAEALKEVEGAEVKSFKVVTGSKLKFFAIAIDNNALYWRGVKVESSAGGSFQLLTSDYLNFPQYGDQGFLYGRDSEHIYLFRCYEGCKLQAPLPNSDAASFEVLKDGYAKDATQVYYEGEILVGADASTFTYLGNGYAKDKNRGYFWGEILPEVSSASFQSLNPSGENLYCQLPFAKDADTVFLREKPLLDMDAPTFEFLDPSGFFFKDKTHIYRAVLEGKGDLCDSDTRKLIPEADLATFKALGNNHFGSKGKIYYITRSGQVSEVMGADYASFQPLYATLSNSAAVKNIDYAKDKNHAYYLGKAIVGIDAATFTYDETLNKWKDKNGSYTWQDLWERANS